ncbi:MAG: hypothetical protein JWP20_758 [Roseomonas sp.]|jgi:hypothetical protein|nr:hypothetical protein [Roseomonas sp.]
MMRGAAVVILVALVALPAAAAEYRRPSATQMQELRRWLCPNGGSPVRGAPGRCDGGGGRRGYGGASPAPGWDRGLPTASRAQSKCPEGTRPVLARGHDDVVRCLPG